MGPVLLSGDAVHFLENYDYEGVPGFNFAASAGVFTFTGAASHDPLAPPSLAGRVGSAGASKASATPE